jgi:hypothetical protein
MTAKTVRLDPNANPLRRSADHSNHIDQASQIYEQKQTAKRPTNVIAPKSRPITSITPAEKVQ